MKLFRSIVMLLAVLFLQACNVVKEESVLEQISGVWRAQGDSAMIVIHTADNRTSFYVNDMAIPVTVGSVDNENKTVNFNVKQADGTPEIWTIQQIWDEAGKTFHLRATLGNVQDDLSFVRKVSVDDLNRLSALSNPKTGAIGDQAPATSPAAALPEMPTDAPEAPEADDATLAATPAPEIKASFDCDKASTHVEILICGNDQIAAADVELAETYALALECAGSPDAVRAQQKSWLASERNGCSDDTCLLQAYQNRQLELERACTN